KLGTRPVASLESTIDTPDGRILSMESVYAFRLALLLGLFPAFVRRLRLFRVRPLKPFDCMGEIDEMGSHLQIEVRVCPSPLELFGGTPVRVACMKREAVFGHSKHKVVALRHKLYVAPGRENNIIYVYHEGRSSKASLQPLPASHKGR